MAWFQESKFGMFIHRGPYSMHNKVVYRMARRLRKTGCIVWRFNYRGVN